MDAIVIFRPLRPIYILVCTRMLFCFMYDLDLCMCIWILDSLESSWLYYIFFCGFLRELVQYYYLIPPASRACYNVHETLGGAFSKRHRADYGVIAPIRKVPILGRHRPSKTSVRHSSLCTWEHTVPQMIHFVLWKCDTCSRRELDFVWA
jgi:hypothetical protein